MFSGPIVWRGIVYTILMMVSKLLCGVWLLSFASPLQSARKLAKKISGVGKNQSKILAPGAQCAVPATGRPESNAEPGPQQDQQPTEQEAQAGDISLQALNAPEPQVAPPNASAEPEMPISVYPACILGLAMVARGEIGYLISALAESTGIFSGGSGAPDRPSEIFLIVTWAITLCTIIGPVCVGLFVTRVKLLELRRVKASGEGRRNVLGAWGVS